MFWVHVEIDDEAATTKEETPSKKPPRDLSEFSDDEINFLFYMFHKRRITPSRTQPIELIKRDLGRKIKNLKRVIQNLKNKGLLGEKPKAKSRRTFWVDAGETERVLREYGRI